MGYKIVPIASKINYHLQRRPDIQAVYYHGDYIMVIPRVMLAFPNKFHKDLIGCQLPDYFTCEKTLYLKTFSGKNDYGKAL